ncbi:hypothetical protein TNCV_1408401 [Trichonephila clavipes]|uniref:Uncharacterized protein n=1 Tax=Trichonephila clavipes TaxID=2585209 RepID=A0A8X6UP15_TRICX|nr:hypothetical protein TNCV_1408401 [Trichonephila clavipes]
MNHSFTVSGGVVPSIVIKTGLKLSHSSFQVIDSNDPSYLALENMTEPADYKYYKNVQTAQELILRTALEKQTTAIMNSVQTMLESMFKHLVNIIEISKQPSSSNREKKANLPQQKFDIAVPSLSQDKDNSYNSIDIG